MMENPDILIIGGGPAGLAAAETASAAGCTVLLTEQKPSLGRKFLMAGKSGLNLTKAEDWESLMDAIKAPWLGPIVARFNSAAVQDWARGLGEEVFTGSSGRVFPVSMKGSPLLRAWLTRLADQGVQTQVKWRWLGWDGTAHRFATPEGEKIITPRATVLAMGGASWARLGSDGEWKSVVSGQGIETTDFKPANMGFNVDWTPHMERHFGAPIKGVTLAYGDTKVTGEFVISRNGIEGSAVYAISAPLRDGMTAEGLTLTVDLSPDQNEVLLRARLGRPRGKTSLSNHLRKSIRMSAAKIALLREAGLPDSVDEQAALIKACPIHLTSARPIDEAISVAGGVAESAMNHALMLTNKPGVFCAGEMLDWEAPTGGYLLTVCLATGRYAGAAAADWVMTD